VFSLKESSLDRIKKNICIGTIYIIYDMFPKYCESTDQSISKIININKIQYKVK